MPDLGNYRRYVAAVAASQDACAACLRAGSRWAGLRLCLSCGHVGCCEDSDQRHAQAHARATGHPLVERYAPRSGEPV